MVDVTPKVLAINRPNILSSYPERFVIRVMNGAISATVTVSSSARNSPPTISRKTPRFCSPVRIPQI